MSKLGEKRLVKKDNWHAYVCTPAYDGKVDYYYSQSLAESAFCAPLYNVYITHEITGNGAFIELARNIYVKKFLEKHTDATHLFFIDSDLKWEMKAFIGLIRAGLPICAGVYRRRQEPEDYPVKFAPHPENGGLWVDDGWVMAERVPTGFLCISRKVLEEMSADAPKIEISGQGLVPWVFHTSYDGKWQPQDGDKFEGEDFTFCDKYRAKYGKPIPVWPNIDFTHGGYQCNLLKHLEREIEKEDAAAATSSAA